MFVTLLILAGWPASLVVAFIAGRIVESWESFPLDQEGVKESVRRGLESQRERSTGGGMPPL